MGGYDDTPQQMAEHILEFASSNFLNLAGGCCGSTPDHIRCVAVPMMCCSSAGSTPPIAHHVALIFHPVCVRPRRETEPLKLCPIQLFGFQVVLYVFCPKLLL